MKMIAMATSWGKAHLKSAGQGGSRWLGADQGTGGQQVVGREHRRWPSGTTGKRRCSGARQASPFIVKRALPPQTALKRAHLKGSWYPKEQRSSHMQPLLTARRTTACTAGADTPAGASQSAGMTWHSTAASLVFSNTVAL